jgi:uncharacterized protein (DUF1501 family)
MPKATHGNLPRSSHRTEQVSRQSSTSRRSFLQTTLAGSAGIAIGAQLPDSWLMAAANSSKSDRVLLVIQLTGGNDGLNTVVPYRNADYKKARPKLAIGATDVLKIDGDLGFHPSLTGVSELMEAGQFSVLQGVGYASPNRSHFESMDIWHTCHRKEDRKREGWIGNLLSSTVDASSTDAPGLHLGTEDQPLALASRDLQVPSVASIEQFRMQIADDQRLKQSVQQLVGESKSVAGGDLLNFIQAGTSSALAASERLDTALKSSQDSAEFPKSALGEKLRIVARLISAGLSTRVYYVTLDGFDTHAQQPAAHTSLLKQWSEALSSFMKQMDEKGHADRVLVMTFSEFGRRVAENASEGTDHGAAAPMFLAGKSVKHGVVGKLPSLTDLDDGDQRFHTDFRNVYATLIEDWFGVPSDKILGEQFKKMDLIRTA